jgi:hypothetical protein
MFKWYPREQWYNMEDHEGMRQLKSKFLYIIDVTIEIFHVVWRVSRPRQIFQVIRGCIQKFPYWVDNEINNNNKHSLGRNTKGYGGKKSLDWLKK